MNCIRCGQTWESGMICPTCGFDHERAEETILGWYEQGQRAEADKRYEAAAEHYRNAADLGLISAQLAYGRMLETGRGVKKAPLRAREYYRSAAAYGDAEAAFALARLLRAEDKNDSDIGYWTQVAAELGLPEAQFALAEMYKNGSLPAPDGDMVAYYYALSAGSGHSEAALSAGELCLSGNVDGATEGHAKWFFEKAGEDNRAAARYLRRLRDISAEAPVIKRPVGHDAALCDLGQTAERKGDNAIAFSLYNLSAEGGYPRALYRLGLCYENAVGVLRDPAVAYARYTEAAEAGSVEALLQLAGCYRYGRGVEIDPAVAFSYYLAAAEKQNARAQYTVGEAYLDGDMTERSIRKALYWLEKAAIQGHSEAISRVNALHDTMTEVYNAAVQAQNKGDNAEALRLYVMVAEMGHSAAQCNAGYCYQTGKGTKRDAKRALYYYRLAAEGGSRVADYNMGLAYAKGIGVRLDFEEAKVYLERAAGKGYAAADELLAMISRQKDKKLAQYLYAASTVVYQRGEMDECIRLLVRSAKLGNLRATYMLGCHFEFGDGIPVDMEKADALYEKAAAGGLDAIRANLKDGYMRQRKILSLKRQKGLL